MKTIAIIQARMGSTRLPNKVMKTINGVPMIGLLLKRLGAAKKIDKIILATSVSKNNQPLVEYVKNLGYQVFQGSENDVLERYYDACKDIKPDAVVRITGDCPLVDPNLVDEVVDAFHKSGVQYYSNIRPATYPDGLDIEIFSFEALEQAQKLTTSSFDREHVTPFINNSGIFSKANHFNDIDYSNERWTVDEKVDFEVITNIFNHFYPDIFFNWKDVLELNKFKPELFIANKGLVRNEGAHVGSGQKLWRRAKKVIPGGNMLLSKRPEIFLPNQWPSYFSKAKGCKVWDLDGKEYVDMTIMGIGTNTLGYGHPEVDEAVIQTVKAGNMTTLNCPEEVYLAEKLVQMHPWANMVRFARSGGEANAIAIRIARAATGKEKVAICGYHGWHDWYLATNLGDQKNLAGHLIPGLEPNGVPKQLIGTVFPFNYNCFDELEVLINKHDIGVIKMEVSRNHGPEDNFLQKVRKIATQKGIVLIFDECTSGFRQSFGGLHLSYDVVPDMAMFGKALGNGYAITAIIGSREIMEAAQTTFISSTFWTERIGPTAALKTLEVMESIRSWEQITETGKIINSKWEELACKYDLAIKISGLPSLTTFSFNSSNALAYKTFITQEMLAKGFLASTGVYVCIDHTPQIIAEYFDNLDPVFKIIKECEDGRSIESLLKGPVCHSGFKRLN